MAQLLIRGLDDSVKEGLRKRAKRHGVSMEQEARKILQDAVSTNPKPEYGLGTEIANLFRDIPDNDEPFERRLNQPMRRIDFDE